MMLFHHDHLKLYVFEDTRNYDILYVRQLLSDAEVLTYWEIRNGLIFYRGFRISRHFGPIERARMVAEHGDHLRNMKTVEEIYSERKRLA